MADEEEPGALPAVRHVNVPIVVPSSASGGSISSASSAGKAALGIRGAAAGVAPTTPTRKEEEKKQDSSSALLFDESPFDEANNVKREVQLKELDDIVAKISMDDEDDASPEVVTEPVLKSNLQYQPPPQERELSPFLPMAAISAAEENKDVKNTNEQDDGDVRNHTSNMDGTQDISTRYLVTPTSHGGGLIKAALKRTVSVPDHPGDEQEEPPAIRPEVIVDQQGLTPTSTNPDANKGSKVMRSAFVSTSRSTPTRLEYDTPDDETADNAVPTFTEIPDDERAMLSGMMPWRQKMVNMTPESAAAYQYHHQEQQQQHGPGYNSVANHSKDDPSELTFNDSEFGTHNGTVDEDDDVASKMMDDANRCFTQAVTIATDILADGFATVGSLIEDAPPKETSSAPTEATSSMNDTMATNEAYAQTAENLQQEKEKEDKEQPEPEIVETDPDESDPEVDTDPEESDPEETDLEETSDMKGTEVEETEVEKSEVEKSDTEDEHVVTVIPAVDTSDDNVEVEDDDNHKHNEQPSQEQAGENWARQVPSLLGELPEDITEGVDRDLIFADKLETPEASTLLLAAAHQEEANAPSATPDAMGETPHGSFKDGSSSMVDIATAMDIAPTLADSTEVEPSHLANVDMETSIPNIDEGQQAELAKLQIEEEPLQEINSKLNAEPTNKSETAVVPDTTAEEEVDDDNEWDPMNDDAESVTTDVPAPESDDVKHYITDAILKGAAFHAKVLGLDSSGRSSFMDMPMDERMVGPEGVDPWMPPTPRSVTPVPGLDNNNSSNAISGSRNVLVNPSVVVRSESHSSMDSESVHDLGKQQNVTLTPDRTYTTEVNISHDDYPPDEERPPVFENRKEYPEVKAMDEKKKNSPIQNRTSCILVAIILVLLFGVILVGIAFGTNAFKRSASGIVEAPTEASTYIPSASPVTQPPTMQRNDALGALLREISLAPARLDDSSSTEALSLRFLQNVDPLQLNPNDTSPRNQAIIRQRYALATLYFAAGAKPNPWTVQSNWMDENECDWFGISCIGRVVTGIEMPENSISGTLSPELGLLSDLRTLVLSNNDLEGTIPSSWSSMTRIETLQLNNNRLSGPIPRSLYMPQLADFVVEDNMLTGTLATEMGLMTAATRFVVGINAFSGSIPKEASSMTGLELFDLNGNSFQGTIPPQLGSLSNLVIFRVADNSLTGVIPEGFGNVPSLIELNLDNNQLSGTIPSTLGNLVNLQVLRVGDNSYDGQVFPEFVYRLTNLVDIWLENCALSGTLSSGVGRWQNVSLFRVNGNVLSGTVPTELGLLPNVVQIRLEQNTFSGSIPTELGAISSLVDLRFHFNNLTGTVPTELGKLLALQRLSFGSNFITGSIPEELMQLSRMVIFSCEDNFLEGSIPAAVGNWEFLQTFECQINRFDSANQTGLVGGIPSAFGNMQRLRVLSLYQNGFTGTIPTELGNARSLQVLDLELNNLSGAVPSSLGQLTQLQQLRVGGNQDLLGPLPLSLCDLTTLTGFRASCGLTCTCCTERCGARDEAVQ